MAAPATLKELLKTHTVEGELYERMENDRLRCYACGHRCVILPGLDGICRVRYNEGGRLRVPAGYVGGLQCDPVEKKPFFHAYPGSLALTFGMLGCDYHCSYCFTGDTVVITNRGPLTLKEAFESADRVDLTTDAEIAYPEDLKTVTASGGLKRVRAVFKHQYEGRLAIIRPYYLPELRCTPDHQIYATDDAVSPPAKIEAQKLTKNHYLAIPRHHDFSSSQAINVFEQLSGHQVTYRVPWALSLNDRQGIATQDHHLVPIRDMTFTEYEGNVYNMEVEEDHSYLANFVAVSNCQNYITSQALRDPVAGVPPKEVSPRMMVEVARKYDARLIVSSYNEPLITSEWAVDIFKQARPAGFVCGYVSNGNATPQVLDYIRPWTDLYKIDLKGFDDKKYRKLGGLLEHVLDTIRMVYERGFWLEIVTLIIPGFNDSTDELKAAADFIASVSPDIPWHVTAFHKDYKMTGPDNTPVETLIRAAEIGYGAGLRFVYAGNIPGRVGKYENTFCPNCKATLIERYGFRVLKNRIENGACPKCNTIIPGRWESRETAPHRKSTGLPILVNPF
ncbi:MAG: radical SAM protein [Blastocatellia bacterium]|nr:radical SAM protein [Blastocatellia bacterium]